MGSNFFDIPFRLSTPRSDFICKDGEIASSYGLEILSESGEILSEGFHENLSSWSSLTPPVPDIDFALARDTLKGWHALPDDFPSKQLYASTPSMEYWNQMGALLLQQFRLEASAQHLFTDPFYVLAVWRDFSGICFSPSEPVLMIPNSETPIVATFDNTEAAEVEFRIAAALGSLYFKMRAPEALRDWVKRIDSLDIFVSSPLRTYEKTGELLPVRRVSTDNYCRCLNLSTGEINDQKVCTITLPQAWLAPTAVMEDVSRVKFYPFASIPLSQVDIADKWGKAGQRGIGDSLFPSGSEGLFLSELIVPKSITSSKTVTLRGKDCNFSLVTRPLKLSGASFFKMATNINLRGIYSPENITLSVYGSRDMLKWWKIAERKGETGVTLPRSYFRFFKVEVSGYLSIGENLQGVSINIS